MSRLINWKIKLLIMLALIGIGGVSGRSVYAQGGLRPGQPVTMVGSAPGACTTNVSLPVVYNGILYQCVGGSYSSVSTTAAGGSITGLTATRVPVAASATTLTDYAGFTHDGTTLTVAGLKDTGLTSGRVPYATTGGLLTDSANLTWDSSNGIFYAANTSASAQIQVTSAVGFDTYALRTYNTSTERFQIVTSVGSTVNKFVGLTSGYNMLFQTNAGIFQWYNGSWAMYLNTANQLAINSNSNTAQFDINVGSSSRIGQIIKLAPGQSADALQVQDSTGATLTRITSGGNLIFGAAASSSYPMLLNNGTARLGVKYADATGYAEIESAPIRIYSTGTTSPIIDIARYSAFITSVSNGGYRWESTSSITGAADTGLSRIAAGVVGIGTGAAGSVAGSMSMTNLTLAGNFFAGPSTIESFTTNASALGTLNYYTDSQTIYYDTAAATADVTINVDASASVDLNTRLATGQMVTVVLALTNTGTAYKCNTLQVHSVGQTIKWVGGAAPTGNINAVDWYTFTIMKTGASTYYVTGSQTSYK